MAVKKNITYRWMVYGFSMIAAVLLIAGAFLVGILYQFYYQQVVDILEERAQLHRRAVVLQVDSDDKWEQDVLLLVENFDNKEQLELQALSKNGKVLASSIGFASEGSDALRDYQAAVQSPDGIVIQSGYNGTGEHIMALTAVERNAAGQAAGALRYVVTMRLIDQQLLLSAVLIGLVVLMILFFTALAGMYFIRSIVHPVKEIGRAARRIAKGDYAYRMEKRTNDELGELCDTINYMAGEIGRSEQLKNEFISSVSHELRTPLTAIRGWSDTLRTVGAEDPALTEKGMQVIAEETDRLTAMVEELLDFARLQNGKLSLQFEQVDIAEILNETVFLFKDRADKQGISLQLVGKQALPFVNGDADRLRQVFINVLDNAIKYSDAGDIVRVDYAVMDQSVQVVIGDNGKGISEQDLPRVKQKFYKADMTRPGSGIGLAVAEEIIKGHGGTLELHSKQAVGTSVIITLPEKGTTL